MDPRPPGGVRFVGGLMKLNAILTALGAAVLIAKSGDDAFFEWIGVDPGFAGFRGLVSLLIAGLTWVLVMALYDRSRGARAVVAVVTGIRIAVDVAALVGASGTSALAVGVGGDLVTFAATVDIMSALLVLYFLYGTPSATEWFARPAAPPVAMPPPPA
jgi:hypothetical protein